MSRQEEFHELELALKNIPEKKLDLTRFHTIHTNLMEEASLLDRKEARIKILKKAMWGLTGCAALFLLFFFGLSITGPLNSTSQQESAKVAHDSGGASFDGEKNASTIPLELEVVEEHLKASGLVLAGQKRDSQNVFHQVRNGVSPSVYSLSHGELSVYVFETEQEVQDAMEEFNEATATMDLVDYQPFEIRNVLMFYIGDDAGIRENISRAIAAMNKNKQ
ncbi:hypothetical protein A8F94_18220 [Bacillus sp. FJAT-27225]|uniref:hypothetical protein n=1 Tax=Bacillus sp. FJAT-27225 TaxID=1743144 RepID=UPI00080C2E60|nr:hypothetical protein [Bacillus sp. FJAT-27225]OCA83073.1 hypothetical protein A8F94_18220 [Bacillus sp. FJAT-27225]